jgi:hypothetical protein
MLARVRSKVTYANLVASLALFVALGGVSYAAITIPNNSIGSKQLKANAVTSAKIKNGTLQKDDFAPKELPALGSNGVNGVNGAPGTPGASGAKGEDRDLGLLDPDNYLSGTAVAQITIESFPSAIVRGYRIDCANEKCSLSIGMPMNSNIELDAWYELALLGDPSATKSFSITEYTTLGGTPIRRYHVTNGRPMSKRTLNERLEVTFSTEFIQRVAI